MSETREEEHVPISEELETKIETEEPPIIFELPLFDLINDLQQRHGLRLDDYNRYCHFITRKLRKIRTQLKFKQGRNRYIQKPIPSYITSQKYLQLVLLQAERAWSAAVLIKATYFAADSPISISRHHFICKFAKAKKYAEILESLCISSTDMRSRLEAQAYRLFMSTTLGIEKEIWLKTLQDLIELKRLILQLSRFSPASTFYNEKITCLGAQIRLCRYNLHRSGTDVSFLLDDAEKSIPIKSNEQEAISCRWRGTRLSAPKPAIHEALSTCINTYTSKCNPDQPQILNIINTTSIVEEHGAVILDFMELLRNVQKEIINTGGAENPTWTALEGFCMEMAILVPLQRNLMLLLQVFGRLSDLPCDLTVTETKNSASLEEGIRYSDLIKQGLTLLQNSHNLTPEIERFLEELHIIVKNCRCFCMALYFLSLEKHNEAHTLLESLRTRFSMHCLESISEQHFAQLVPLFRCVEKLLGDSIKPFSILCQLTVINKSCLNNETSIKSSNEAMIQYAENLGEGDPFLIAPKQMYCKPFLIDVAFGQMQAPDLSESIKFQKKGLMGKLSSWWKR